METLILAILTIIMFIVIYYDVWVKEPVIKSKWEKDPTIKSKWKKTNLN